MDQAPVPSLEKELMGVPYLFNLIAIVLSLIPFLLICVVPMTKEVKRYFPIRSFIVSTLLNFTLVWHIMFVQKVNEHLDALYVCLVGMTLSTACAYIWLLHAAVFGRPVLGRLAMAMVIGAFLYASYVILYAIQNQLHVYALKGPGLFYGAMAGLTALFLNAYPVLKASLCGTPAEPDIPVDIYGFVMTLINTVDASYFVVYASYTGHFGSLLSLVSCITALFVLVVNLFKAMVRSVNCCFCIVLGFGGMTLVLQIFWAYS